MKALLIRNVDREDGWVSGFAVTIPETIKTYAEAVALSKVQEAIKEYDWKKPTYADNVDSVEISKYGVEVEYSNGDECFEAHFGFDFIDVIGE